ncbi:MAG: cytochrome c biogenesis protein CcsA [Thermomonas sp.]|uniref:cytochrome C assembly family protein n=1 Tax=Thermomonas sp. TaxID=1971895 RepID=UPI00261EF9F3|nr:cytochrome c biogenesis protein CcsA [Thermomonas sp.]MCC7097538.1 cytochrome c biogenesis protein CcsA [Thermomonas sp.]
MVPNALAAVLYALATLWLVRDARDPEQRNGRGWLWFAAPAVCAHAYAHWQGWRFTGTTDLHFFAALSLGGLGMAALTVAGAATGTARALGVVVFPLAALMLLAYGVYGHTIRPQPLSWQLLLHAWLALLSYATLSLAAVLAVFLWAQERALRRRDFNPWLRALPPLTELESLLFRTITVGFILLTGTLLTGALYVENLFAQHLVHHTVLSILSWLAFGALLLGRWRRGWRGALAVRWTLTAMALLVLAFFGSKFVLELVLRRGG